jgi:hypothetical protein
MGTERVMTTKKSLTNTVVAIMDPRADGKDAVADLTAAGYEVDVMHGAEGKDRLDPRGERGGVMATVQRLINAFGDEFRVLDQLEAAVDEGKVVVSVDIDADDPGPAVDILREHGGTYIWKFDRWTFTRIGADEPEDDQLD